MLTGWLPLGCWQESLDTWQITQRFFFLLLCVASCTNLLLFFLLPTVSIFSSSVRLITGDCLTITRILKATVPTLERQCHSDKSTTIARMKTFHKTNHRSAITQQWLWQVTLCVRKILCSRWSEVQALVYSNFTMTFQREHNSKSQVIFKKLNYRPWTGPASWLVELSAKGGHQKFYCGLMQLNSRCDLGSMRPHFKVMRIVMRCICCLFRAMQTCNK